MPSAPRGWILNPFHSSHSLVLAAEASTHRCPAPTILPWVLSRRREDPLFSLSFRTQQSGRNKTSLSFWIQSIIYTHFPHFTKSTHTFNFSITLQTMCPLHSPSPTISPTLMNNSLNNGSKGAAWDHPHDSPVWVDSVRLGACWVLLGLSPVGQNTEIIDFQIPPSIPYQNQNVASRT